MSKYDGMDARLVTLAEEIEKVAERYNSNLFRLIGVDCSVDPGFDASGMEDPDALEIPNCIFVRVNTYSVYESMLPTCEVYADIRVRGGDMIAYDWGAEWRTDDMEFPDFDNMSDCESYFDGYTELSQAVNEFISVLKTYGGVPTK